MQTCPICGRCSLKIWNEYDVDGRSEHYEECLNPNCGEDESEDEI